MIKIKNVFEKFRKVRIAVVGDIMLDNYIYGDVERISPEAPVPVVKIEKEVSEVGTAAYVASNIASLGGQVFLFGYTGKDKAKEKIVEILNEKMINFNLYDILNKTTQKTRIVGNGHQIARIDNEEYAIIPPNIEESLAKSISKKSPDVIVISDYAKGCVTHSLFAAIKKHNPGVKIIVDPKPKNKDVYSDIFLIKPNIKEAREITGLTDVREIGTALQKKYNSNILITLGKDGMSCFSEEKVFNIPTRAREVYDVTGAGDAVTALLGLGIASGLSIEESAFLANQAAGIVVGKAGTSVISKEELKQALESETRKLNNLDELKRIREDYARKGKKVIWTNGCFDILHAGHTDYLKKARMLGDALFLGLNSDCSIKKFKGADRPINSEDRRAEVLSSLECVDYIVIFDDQTSENCIRELKPDVYVKAGDIKLYADDKQYQAEKRIVEEYGGESVLIPIVHNVSTTNIINQIKNGEKNGKKKTG